MAVSVPNREDGLSEGVLKKKRGPETNLKSVRRA